MELQDGDRFWALLELDEAARGDLCGVGLFMPNGEVVFHGDDNFAPALMAIGVRASIPTRYKYSGGRIPFDYRVGNDGWAKEPTV